MDNNDNISKSNTNVTLTLNRDIMEELNDIFGQNEQELLNFIGIPTDIEEYELHFTHSADILNFVRAIDTEPEVEYSKEEKQEIVEFDETDKEQVVSTIQIKEAEIAADIKKYLKVLKSKESLEFEQISREEIFERLKCRCFEWQHIKKKETIRDVIKQICRDKKCKKEVERHEEEEIRDLKKKKRSKKRKKMTICSGPMRKRLLRRKKKRRYTKKQIKQIALLREKISRETIRTEIKKFADFVQSFDSKVQRDDSSSSEESIAVSQIPNKILRAKDSVLLRKPDDGFVHKADLGSSESITSTKSENLQHLDSLDKIGKRKIHPKMFNMYLNEFNSIKNFAFVFIDNILHEASTKVNVSIMDPLEFDINDYICPEICGEADQFEPESIPEKTISLFSQVYGFDLTPKEGKSMVRNIIKYWKMRKTWKYYINFLGQQTDSCGEYFNYEVKWSEPTFSYPVPQVTASVFFTIELSRVKPTLFPPKVTFVFECERYKFTSFDDITHEKFLDDIIDCKRSFFKSMRF